MDQYDDDFFDENIEKINHLSARVLIAGNIVPLALFIFTKLGIFRLPTQLLFIAQCILVFASLIQFSLLKVISNSKFKSSNPFLYRKIQNFSKY